MSRYLERLKTLLAEKRLPEQPTKPTKPPSVGFDSDQGRHVSRDDGAEADPSVSSVSSQSRHVSDDEAAIEERAGLAADRVPPVYLDAWARLNCQKPFSVSESEWRLTLDDGGRFLDAWGSETAETGWTPGELFDVRAGLVWRLAGQSVKAFAWDNVWLDDGRVIFRRELGGAQSFKNRGK
jgi:hypothetical protein